MLNPLHVTLDGFNLALPRGTGIATYARTLSHALKNMSARVDILYGFDIPDRTPPALQEVLFYENLGDEEPKKNTVFMSDRWKQRCKSIAFGCRAHAIMPSALVDGRSFRERMPAHDQILNARDLFLAAARCYRTTGRFLTVELPETPDIMHWTYPFPIRAKGARNIYTIHDLVPLQLPHTTRDNKGYYLRLIGDIAKNAEAICTVSETSKAAIGALFPDATSRIHNTYQTPYIPSDCLTPDEDMIKHALKHMLDLNWNEYYLFYGSLEPKKNIGRILEAVLSSSIDRPLVIVSAMAWKVTGELRLLDHGVKTGRILLLDYLSQSVLIAVLRGARALLFPSLAEGFGLPVVEAMTFGTPVLTSREGALAEIGGEAVLSVDPYDVSDIIRSIETLDKDDAVRARLRTAGPAQADHFNMDRYQARLTAVYADVMSRPVREA